MSVDSVREANRQFLIDFMGKHKLGYKPLANLCGYSSRTIYRWSNGSRPVPKPFLKWVDLWVRLDSKTKGWYI